MTIVAISRQMGSGGYTIAAAVAKALSFDYVDREILLHAARVLEVPEDEIASVAERGLNLWERLDEEKLRYLTFLQAAYYAFVEKDNVVTAGRGGPSLLQGIDHALRVRIVAPFEVRVRRVMQDEGLDHATAAAKVRAYDRDVTPRVAYLFGADWTLPENYDLVINTVRDDLPLYTDLVISLARHPRFQATPESIQQVKDLSLAAQVRAAIAKDPETKTVSLEITARRGHVVLKGGVRSLAVRERVEGLARKVPGVASVSSAAVQPALYPGPIV